MTDTVTFFRAVVAGTNQFIAAYENLQLLADRLATDSSLSTNTAAAANAGGRTDLNAANFDNFRLAALQIAALMNASNANVPNGGDFKLSFYQIV